MSYLLSSKCKDCLKQDKCVDRHFVQGAIAGIHEVNSWSISENRCVNKGHLGCGTIELQCSNFEEMGKPATV
jgi:hypothetical protein